MSRKILLLGILLIFNSVLFAQDNVKKYHNFDFSKKLITKAELNKFRFEEGEVEPINELALLRGVVFGKHGRIFVEKSVQNYLEKQSWYKPNPKFSNSVLTQIERQNLDLIRLKEAELHYSVEPGDLRYWKDKEIPEDKIYTNSAADWSVLIAEFEAIHGKTFPDQEWLQKYFDERYWYKRNPNYTPTMLSANERKNLEKFIA
ncbi:MAG TPA: YARHG domain-containing protein, partial [Pyrinomonadaceae bacterium]|nr:YARHG domain-containing protein [Pyrinomonadaceae bacterium]